MLFAVFLMLAVSTIIWKRILPPIEAIAHGMEAFSSEATSIDIKYNKNDELGDLARTFTRMTARLEKYQSLSNERIMRSTAALQSILNHSPDAFFILTENQKPVYSSPKAEELLSDSTIKHSFPPEMSARFKTSLETNEASLSRNFNEAIRLVVQDTERWFLVQAFPLTIPVSDLSQGSNDSNDHNLAVILQDVTLLKLADSLRKDLIATVSHELKTPITSARMSLYLLLEETLGPINEDQKELLETARDDVNRQLSTIEGLVDLSRIESDAGKLKLSHFKIADVIKESIKSHLEIAKSYKVEIHYAIPVEPISIEADRNGINIAINNLLVNAVKYSGPNKQVWISSSVSDERLKVSVRDNGNGMDADTLSTVFEAYARGTPSESKADGTGLGLKITKDIVDNHGGQIGCYSQPGEGSEFFFEIPVAQA
jgi:signal transduction histidine kinase/HAMP domain-containing protein